MVAKPMSNPGTTCEFPASQSIADIFAEKKTNNAAMII